MYRETKNESRISLICKLGIPETNIARCYGYQDGQSQLLVSEDVSDGNGRVRKLLHSRNVLLVFAECTSRGLISTCQE